MFIYNYKDLEDIFDGLSIIKLGDFLYYRKTYLGTLNEDGTVFLDSSDGTSIVFVRDHLKIKPINQ